MYADGFVPNGPLTFDKAGNLYGTTVFGPYSTACPNGNGTVFELSPISNGSWGELVLHTFTCGGTDGANPYAGVTLDSSGNIYGTTAFGGNKANCMAGCGTVFELAPVSGWTESQLYVFQGGSDGSFPQAPVIFDKAGNLYGTTYQGGSSNNFGVVFKLAKTSGGWKETVIHSFAGQPTDAANPNGGLVAKGGHYYGLTSQGGASNLGAVYELTHTTSGWTETVLHSFAGSPSDGATPYGGVIVNPAGNLYGTTQSGGAANLGIVFEVTP